MPGEVVDWAEDEILELIKRYRQCARDNFDRDGYIAPVMFLLATRHPEGGPAALKHVMPCVFPSGFGSPDADKATITRVIAQASEAVGARAVIVISEVWIGVGAAARAYQGRLEECPDRKEAVVIQLERAAAGNRSWGAEIIRPKVGKPTLGRWSEIPEGAALRLDRFDGVLPKSS